MLILTSNINLVAKQVDGTHIIVVDEQDAVNAILHELGDLVNLSNKELRSELEVDVSAATMARLRAQFGKSKERGKWFPELIERKEDEFDRKIGADLVEFLKWSGGTADEISALLDSANKHSPGKNELSALAPA